VEGDLQRTVGRGLRTHRQALGLSQEAFGEVLGYHRTETGALERGECNLTLRRLERIASRIGVDPIALLTHERKVGSVVITAARAVGPSRASRART
jgi:transcriptional regulator with XRE-family HTH domain